jgi:GNAT superfamily N-acetyltransferase
VIGQAARVIRSATPADLPAILRLVRELAEYERGLHEVRATEDLLGAALFADHPAVFCDVVEHDGAGVVGFALWFVNFSTWLGRHGIYLEDLFVQPEFRRNGYGRRLLGLLAQRCVERGYGRLEWNVLDWNEPALAFYRTLDAEPLDEWTVHRVSGDALARLAAEVSDGTAR